MTEEEQEIECIYYLSCLGSFSEDRHVRRVVPMSSFHIVSHTLGCVDGRVVGKDVTYKKSQVSPIYPP